MNAANLVVILMVVATVTCALGIGYAVLYFMDKAVDRNVG